MIRLLLLGKILFLVCPFLGSPVVFLDYVDLYMNLENFQVRDARVTYMIVSLGRVFTEGCAWRGRMGWRGTSASVKETGEAATASTSPGAVERNPVNMQHNASPTIKDKVRVIF